MNLITTHASHRTICQWLLAGAAAASMALAGGTAFAADDANLPGKGIKVQPL